jgi:hypothetical protein
LWLERIGTYNDLFLSVAIGIPGFNNLLYMAHEVKPRHIAPYFPVVPVFLISMLSFVHI